MPSKPLKNRKKNDKTGRHGGANANISGSLGPGDLESIEANARSAVADLLRALRIDDDHNTADTPRRVAKMLVREVFSGRYAPRPDLTVFPNAKNVDEIYVLGPIMVRSACAHHLCPIEGHVIVGVIPSQKIMGISKFSRLADWVMARPQIQEEATVQLADEIERAIRPRALAVMVTARHSCMTWRGVREPHNVMTTSVMRGLFRSNPTARAEFLAISERHKLSCR